MRQSGVPKGPQKLAGGDAAEPPEPNEAAMRPEGGARNVGEILAPPAGRGRFFHRSPGVPRRHPRLISAAPPARSTHPRGSLSNGLLHKSVSTSEAGEKRAVASAARRPAPRSVPAPRCQDGIWKRRERPLPTPPASALLLSCPSQRNSTQVRHNTMLGVFSRRP